MVLLCVLQFTLTAFLIQETWAPKISESLDCSFAVYHLKKNYGLELCVSLYLF